MKKLLVLIYITIFALTSYAAGKAKYILQNESISNGKVFLSFNLRATDGSVRSFYSSAVHDDSILKNLPEEKGADYSLCQEGHLNVDLFIQLSGIAARVGSEAVSNTSSVLTAQGIAIIQKTPRCGFYKDMLVSIANLLFINATPSSEKLDKLGLVKIDGVSYIELKTETGASINLKISAGMPKKIKSISDLSGVSVRADNSGQNLSLQISYMDSNFDQSPSQSHRTEACTVTREEKICEKGQCYTRTITTSGKRYISSEMSFDTTTYELKLLDSQSRVLFSGQLLDGEVDSDDTHKSPCIAN